MRTGLRRVCVAGWEGAQRGVKSRPFWWARALTGGVGETGLRPVRSCPLPPPAATPEMKLVLISRTLSRLESTAEEIRGAFDVEVRVVAADLTEIEEETYDRVSAALAGLDVGVLINNAGVSHDHPDYLESLDAVELLNLININIVSLTLLTRLVLRGMKERRRGAVVNIGSGSAALPSCPLLSVYSASKKYVENFSACLAAETAEFGIHVQCAAALFVVSKMSKIRQPRLDVPTPQVWARAALRALGCETFTFPYWVHALMIGVLNRLPRSIAGGQTMRVNRGLRRAYYRRAARKEAEAKAAAGAETKKDA